MAMAPRSSLLGRPLAPPSPGGRGAELRPRAAPCKASVVFKPGDASPFTTDGGEKVERPVVALGKFDALHKGHRSLATEAAKVGDPWLMSFSGMADVLGWPKRLPIVAEPDRRRVLGTWGTHCAGREVEEVSVPFVDIRSLSPEDFVRLLAVDMGVAGVVAGENYRFGFKAAGDADALLTLGAAYGMEVRIVSLVGAHEPGLVGTVSSTKVREYLAAGRVGRAGALLGRGHRCVLQLPRGGAGAGGGGALDLAGAVLLNQAPGEGEYRVRAQLVTSATGGAGGHPEVSLSEGAGALGTLTVGPGEGGEGGLQRLELDSGLLWGGEAATGAGDLVVVDFEGL